MSPVRDHRFCISELRKGHWAQLSLEWSIVCKLIRPFFRFYIKKSDAKRHLAIMNCNVLIILRPLYSFFSEGKRYIWYLTYELKFKGEISKEKRQLIGLYKHNVHVLQNIFKEFLFSSDLEILKLCSSLIMSTPAKTWKVY